MGRDYKPSKPDLFPLAGILPLTVLQHGQISPFTQEKVFNHMNLLGTFLIHTPIVLDLRTLGIKYSRT